MGDSDDRDSTDRAAILARRQRFIALTLSGLAAACGDDAGPTPCLDVAPQTESASTTMPTTSATGDGSGDDSGTSIGTSGMPMPCLDVDPSTTTGTSTTGEPSTDGTDTSGTSVGSGDGSTTTTSG